MQPIDSDAIRRALDTWMQTTENDSKQLLTVVIENISSVRTIHNINKAVFELGNPHTNGNLIQREVLIKITTFFNRMPHQLEANITTCPFKWQH